MTDVPAPADPDQVSAWLDDLNRRLPLHGEVLRQLRDGARLDARVVQVSVGCSIARGTADEFSDIDCELSLSEEAWPSGLELVEPLVRSCGDVVELLHHQWPGAGTGESRRTAVVYASGVQLDLMVWPVSAWSGMRPPNTVVLYATCPVFTRPWDPGGALASDARLREWRFLGWWALLDADKYLRRGSFWEARQRLEQARTVVWQLSAAAQGVPFPEYGITSLLDAAGARLPDAAETTAALNDIPGLRAAVSRCADLLADQWNLLAGRGDDGQHPLPAIPRWAMERLGRPFHEP